MTNQNTIRFVRSIIPVCILLIQSVVTVSNEVHIPLLDVQNIIERLKIEEQMSHEAAVNSVIELVHYYTTIKHGIHGSPSAMVDKPWHAHILNTPMYMEFTKTELGHYVHHIPY
ncbi:unnamed protein product [Rotaria sp. Silwood2]|nr:unnamed protein product [Rotaria sp. Silwood2]CAF2596401.1 unnamed protein product [Rotaria sp. Silwood2]CAF3003797.1 unnamed protein product [Rotaria sp. Silwood2]CAF3867297.1 unnamed protein product [Rotaria sp. Silwood2]CAF4286087.1 unnamed protein product [Rotaria sp. Silwood2]